jgi:hypothetical protein
MTDLLPTIVPKSDQLNADDLIGGPLTIKVTKISRKDDPDQPIAVNFEGDSGKPYKPCKSMRRVMVKIWGPDGAAFVGRRMTLFRDDRVTFGKDAVGGIRISHMSGIDQDVTMALTATRAQRKPYTVRPLGPDSGAPTVHLPVVLAAGRAAAAKGSAPLTAWWTVLSKAEKVAAKPTLDGELKAAAALADQAALTTDDDDGPAFDSEPRQEAQDGQEAGDSAFPGDRAAGAQAGVEDGAAGELDHVAWARGYIAAVAKMETVKEVSDAFAEAKSRGLVAALERADQKLWEDVIEAKDEAIDRLKTGRR